MELRQLNYFVKATETENFSIAAQECFVVQSTFRNRSGNWKMTSAYNSSNASEKGVADRGR